MESVRRRPSRTKSMYLPNYQPPNIWRFRKKYLQERLHARKQQHMQRPRRKCEMLTFHHENTCIRDNFMSILAERILGVNFNSDNMYIQKAFWHTDLPQRSLMKPLNVKLISRSLINSQTSHSLRPMQTVLI